MSGLLKFVKKVAKKLRDGAKKILKSKIFKVIVIAAAVVFTGGMALGALGAAGAGAGTLLGTLQAGFTAGMSALGSIGSAIVSGVQAIGGAIGSAFTAGTQALGLSAAAPAGVGNIASGMAAHGAVVAVPAATTAATTAAGMSGLAKAALVTTGGNMISGYSQGRQQEEMMDDQEKKRMARDQYGIDGHGNSTGTLVDPSTNLASQMSDPSLRNNMDVSLDYGPQNVAAPTVDGPIDPVMRRRLAASIT
jgi:hypothetical protein